MANCDPCGTDSASSVMASRHSRFLIASAWSSTMTKACFIDASADTNSETTVWLAPGEARARKTPGLIGSTRSRATAKYVNNTIGSLSPRSPDSQASRGFFDSAHCANSVVFP